MNTTTESASIAPRGFGRYLRNPGRYLSLSLKSTLIPLCHIFKKSAFFMQGQMDISPRGRWHNPAFTDVTGGFYPADDEGSRTVCDLSAMDSTRRDMLVLLLRTVVSNKISGAFAELGVYKGNTAKLIHYYAPERELHLFDTFSGFTERSVAQEAERTGIAYDPDEFANTSLTRVKAYIQQRNANVYFHPGYFPESIPQGLLNERFAFVHLDADLYEPTMEGLKFFYPRMAKGGMIVVHDYNSWIGARSAVDDFVSGKVEYPIPMPDKSGSALIVKQ